MRADLMGIYLKGTPEIFPNAVETLSFLRKADARLVVVTHGGEEYSVGKAERSGLIRHVDAIYPLDDRKLKDVEAWRGVLMKEGVKPVSVISAGDNWRSDIGPLLDIGVPTERVFRVKAEYDEANVGRIESVCEIKTFSHLPQAIVENLFLSNTF